MSLRDRLAEQIAAGGPLTIAQYMTACLHDPDYGYYATRPSIGGESADFLTAPEVGPLFGTLLEIQIADVPLDRRLAQHRPARTWLQPAR